VAIIDSAGWTARTGITLSGADATALSAACLAVGEAIELQCRPFLFEPATVTGVCDAPTRASLYLPVCPIRSITSLWLNPDANGDSSAFTSDHLLTQYTDYYLPLDPVNGYSRWGEVLRRGSPSWGCERPTLYDRLAPNMTPARGAVKYTVAAGTLTVPDDVAYAASLAVSKLMASRQFGAQVTSASLNGGSYSLPADAVRGALLDPTVAGLLMKYTPIFGAGA
jgi:hypothetical protein